MALKPTIHFSCLHNRYRDLESKGVKMCKLNNNINCAWFSGSKKLAEREYKGNLIRTRFLKVRKGREAEEEPL
jgi:hypothetical protein